MNKNFNFRSGLFALLFSVLISSLSHAEEFQYPELMVVPLASERVQMEAAQEDRSFKAWLDHTPVLAAGAMTALSALSLERNKNDLPQDERADASDISKIALGVSAFWIGYSAYLAVAYHPYKSASRRLSGISTENKKSRLIKERLAEEKIEEAAHFGRMLSWLSAGTLLASSIAVASHGKGKTEALGIAAAATSLAPLLFKYRWQRVAAYHHDYKKRIYGPVLTSSIYGSEKNWMPLLVLSSEF